MAPKKTKFRFNDDFVYVDSIELWRGTCQFQECVVDVTHVDGFSDDEIEDFFAVLARNFKEMVKIIVDDVEDFLDDFTDQKRESLEKGLVLSSAHFRIDQDVECFFDDDSDDDGITIGAYIEHDGTVNSTDLAW